MATDTPTPQTLTEWCQDHNLTKIETKLTGKAGIIDVAELEHLAAEDVEQIIVDCKMNTGQKIRFRNAVDEFSPSSDTSTKPSTPGQSSPASTAASKRTPKNKALKINNQKYELIKQVSKGSFGVVWKAMDMNTNMIVAVKQQPIEDSKCPNNLFNEEVKIHQTINVAPAVPRIPRLITSSADIGDGEEYLVMEFVPGVTAEVYCERVPDFILSGPKATTFLLKTLETLDAVHKKGIIHRDLKPGNIVIQKYTLEPWILDFGIARDLILSDSCQMTDVGIRSFRPPECLDRVGPFTDIFGIGVTTLALTGLLCPGDLTWDSVLQRCPFTDELKKVIARMIEYDYTKRFEDCRAAMKALKRAQPPPPEKTLSGRELPPKAPPTGRPAQPLPHPALTPKHDSHSNLHDCAWKKIRRLKAHASSVLCLTQLTDGTLVSGSHDTTIKLWDASTGSNLRTLTGHTRPVHTVLGLHNGSLASGSNDHTIKIWNPSTGDNVKTFEGHAKTVNCIIQIDGDGPLVSASSDHTIKLWDLETGKAVRTLNGHTKWIRCVIQLVDGILASASDDTTIKIWDMKSGKCIQTLEGHSNYVSCVRQLRDGTLASGSFDHQIKMWDINLGRSIQIFEGVAHKMPVEVLTPLYDGTTIASGSQDKTIKLWDITTGRHIKTIEGHRGHVLDVIQLFDGTLASASADKTIRIWG